MKTRVLILVALLSTSLWAQDGKLIPQVTVMGEGKIKTVPDLAVLSFGITHTGKEANEVKKANDQALDKVIKFIKKFGIATTDFQTTQVSLNKNYQYDTKKYTYQATQNLTLTLKDISKYDALVMGLMDNGINTIHQVEFKSTQIEILKSNARKLAIQDAKKKAEDFAGVLNQKIGKALSISDNSQPIYPVMMKRTYANPMLESDAATETLAIGEIEISISVTVSFHLD
ncbi:SIMPL domain-containing protein [Flavobacterium sp.]|uniref:SIMPL domain-containing protein n=1 Tax=Flavobacterium sp. TaxID=239 RepID=UPI002FDB36AC